MPILNVIEVISAILLVAAILLQNRGTGLGTAFGGEGNVYRTKRGLEKSLFRATIALAVVFFGSALATTTLTPSAAARPDHASQTSPPPLAPNDQTASPAAPAPSAAGTPVSQTALPAGTPAPTP